MKKFLLLLCALLGTVGAMAQPDVAGKTFTLQCARGYVYYNGSKLAGTNTADDASKFAIVSYDNHTYLYDATQKAFVCHTTAATAGNTGNAALESNNDFSKIVKDITFGSTNIEAYPYYLQEGEFTNWLNMDGSPLVFFNRWTNFEGGNGGNTYKVEVVDDFDATEAVAMLDDYYNPQGVLNDVSQLSNTKVYTITTKRGAWTLNSAGTSIASTHKTNGEEENNGADQTDEAKEFAIVQYEGFYYVYNLKAGGFLHYDGTGTKISPLMGTPLFFEATNNSDYPLKAGTLAKDRFVNNNNSGGIAIDTWTYTDDGNRLAIEATRNLTDDEVTAMQNLLASSPMNPHKAFVVAADRGTWCANAEGTSLATTTTNSSYAEGYNQFAFVRFDNNLYIYNVGAKKFIKKNGSLVEGRGDAIGVRLSGDETYPYMFYFTDGNIYFNMQSGGGRYAMDTYSTPDPGNRQSLTIQDVDAYADAQTEYNKTVQVTYNLVYNGEQVATTTAQEGVGANAVLPSSLDKGIFTYTYNPAYNQTGATTITVTATPIFTISPDYVGATWYNMYIRQNNRWVGYNKGADEETQEPYYPYDASDEDKATKALQWAFVGNPFTTGIKVINREAGRTMSLKNDNGSAVMREGETYWDIFGRNGGILLREQGTDHNYINQAGSANGPFQFWNSSWAATDNGSTMWLVEAPVDETTITYNVKFNGETVATTTATAVIGDPTPLTNLPADIQRDYVVLSGDDTHNVVADDVIELTATWTGPFEISSDFDNAHWYDMAMRGTWYVTSGVKDGDGAYKTQNANTMGLVEDSYQWAILGNPYEGFKIINKAAGDGNSFGYTDEAKVNAGIPTIMTDTEGNHIWTIAKSSSGITDAFTLNVPGTNLYINQYGGAGGSLKFWDSGNNVGDPGSAFTVFDVPNDFHEFAVEEIKPYVAPTGYFSLKDEVKSNIGWQDSYATECSFEAYKSMKEAVQAIDLNNMDNYILPETGYYRFFNPNYEKYMGLKSSTVYGNYSNEADINGAVTVVKLTKNEEGKYSIAIQGKYLQGLSQSQNVPLGDEPAWFTPKIPAIGYGTFSVDGGQYSYIHCAGSGNIVGWTYDGAASLWNLEDATSVSITLDNPIDDKYYATLCVPYDVTIDGATAYTVTKGEGTVLTTTEITDGVVAAGTPVLLVGESASATATIGENYSTAISTETALTGSYLEVANFDGATNYVLGNDGTKAGFFHKDVTTLTTNSAYIAGDESSSSIEAFYFEADDILGDVNNDGSVTIADVTALVNIILGKDTEGLYNHDAADVNNDGNITIADVTALVNIILGKNN